jgi:mannosyl-3-phosphoglycerate phosphatase family protein
MVKKRGTKVKKINYLIFTDLDGTLLDDNCKFLDAIATLKKLKQKNIPVIFCSGKSFVEENVFRKKMNINHPLITEDGSAIYIPKKYFKNKQGKLKGTYEHIHLGVDYSKIKKVIKKLGQHYHIQSYSNMTAKEVGKEMNLDLESAKRAKNRQLSETIIKADKKALKELKKKFNVVIGGKAIHVYGKNTSKGKTVKILTKIYKEELGKVTTIGIGNSYNDEPMLRAVDKPALVKNTNGKWANIRIAKLYKAKNIGPKGWVEVVKKFVLKKDG